MLKLRPYKQADAEKIFSFIQEGKDFYSMTVAGMEGLPSTLPEFHEFCRKVSAHGLISTFVDYCSLVDVQSFQPMD